jgi:hypothetical protein
MHVYSRHPFSRPVPQAGKTPGETMHGVPAGSHAVHPGPSLIQLKTISQRLPSGKVTAHSVHAAAGWG